MDRNTGHRVIRVAEIVLRRASLPALLLVGVVVTVPGNWLRVQNVDPQFAMVLVQRTIHFGGTFYDNAVQDHGPIEPFLYDVAARVGGRNAAWYVISAMATLVSLVLGYVAARTARLTGAARDVGIAVGAAVFVHLTISRSNYAGVLYIRNMTTVLLALAWVLLIDERVWVSPGRRRVGAVAVGCLLGLAVQSLLSTFAAGVLGLVALGLLWSRVSIEERLPLAAILGGSALATFSTAPIYYLLRGDFTEFWSGWVQYGHYMAVGPGQSTGSQLRTGWSTLVRYYSHRPLTGGVIALFVIVVTVTWRAASIGSRIVYVGLFAWWGAAWLELAISQRYSAEYFVVTSVPTALMAAALAGHGWKALAGWRVPARVAVVLPLVVALAAVWVSSVENFDNDVRAAWHFRGANANAALVAKNRRGDERSVQAVLDLVSRGGDPLLVWTNDPWPYLNFDRVPATRFFYKSFLLGEIYLGRTSTAYVLPRTWRWFAQDLRRSSPVAYLRADQPNLPAGNPFASYVASNFQLVYGDPNLPVSLRNDVAKQVLDPAARHDWEGRPPPVAHTGWKVHGDRATYAQGPVPNDDDQLTLSTSSCFRLDGRIDANATGEPGHAVFHFYDNAGKVEELKMSFDGGSSTSSSNAVDFQTEPTGLRAGVRRVPFSLVVGRRSGVVVINGHVRAALLLPRSVTVTVQGDTLALALSHLRTGAAPSGSGC